MAAAGTPGPDRLMRMQAAVRLLLAGLGEDVHRQGLIDTPKVWLTAELRHCTGTNSARPALIMCLRSESPRR